MFAARSANNNALIAPGSGLSIEQRKRLTLATELVAKPSLLFLDEPTSGLDGQSAFEICRFMRKLAASGQTIICTIHQPSATLFDAFDVLLLLARGGRTTYFGPTGKNSATVIDYFSRNGAPCPPNSNPAEHIVDVVQGRFGAEIDWPQTWLSSPESQLAIAEIDALNSTSTQEKNSDTSVSIENPGGDDQLTGFATPLFYQVYLVTYRQLIALWRNPDYVWNKIGLHITNGLFGGFTFWMLGNGTFDLQLRLMAVFNFVFVAPGCINQLQPLFIRNRDVFETREKKSKTYHWFAFVAAQLLSETPVLIVCGTLAFVTWYFTVGFPTEARISGQVYLQMLRKYYFRLKGLVPDLTNVHEISVRISLHFPWSSYCRIQPECVFRCPCQSNHHWRWSHQLLWSRSSVLPDPGLLEILALLARPLYISHSGDVGTCGLGCRSPMQVK